MRTSRCLLLQKRLADNLRFVFRHFPTVRTHPHSLRAAEAAEAAGAQGKFWQMHDELFSHQQALEDCAKRNAIEIQVRPLPLSLGLDRYHHCAVARYFGGKLSGELPEIFVCPQIPHLSRHLLRIPDFGP